MARTVIKQYERAKSTVYTIHMYVQYGTVRYLKGSVRVMYVFSIFKCGREYRVIVPLLRAITKKSPLQQQQTDKGEGEREGGREVYGGR